MTTIETAHAVADLLRDHRAGETTIAAWRLPPELRAGGRAGRVEIRRALAVGCVRLLRRAVAGECLAPRDDFERRLLLDAIRRREVAETLRSGAK